MGRTRDVPPQSLTPHDDALPCVEARGISKGNLTIRKKNAMNQVAVRSVGEKVMDLYFESPTMYRIELEVSSRLINLSS